MLNTPAYIFACALVTVRAMTSHGDDDKWWQIDVPTGSNFVLNGTENQIPYSAQWREMAWVLPDLTKMLRGTKQDIHTPDGTVSVEVSKNGELLQVRNLQKDFFGLYYCLILDNNTTFHVTRRGVNMEHYFADDVIKRYQRYLVITAITAGLLAMTAGLLIGLTYWCHRKAKEEEGEDVEEEDKAEIVARSDQSRSKSKFAEITSRFRPAAKAKTPKPTSKGTPESVTTSGHQNNIA